MRTFEEQEYRNIRILQFGFLAWVVLVFLVQFRVQIPVKPIGLGAGIACTVVALLCSAAVIVLRSVALKKLEIQDRKNPNPRRLLAYFLAFGLAQIVALMGVALRGIGLSPWKSSIFSIASGALVISCGPKRN
jgi:hypothetical protein